MHPFLFVALVLLVVLNAYATRSLYRSPSFDARQRRPQLVMIWLLPVLGALLVIQFAKEHQPGRDARDYSAGWSSDSGLGGYSSGDCSAGDSGGGGDCGGGDGGGGGD